MQIRASPSTYTLCVFLGMLNGTRVSPLWEQSTADALHSQSLGHAAAEPASTSTSTRAAITSRPTPPRTISTARVTTAPAIGSAAAHLPRTEDTVSGPRRRRVPELTARRQAAGPRRTGTATPAPPACGGGMGKLCLLIETLGEATEHCETRTNVYVEQLSTRIFFFFMTLFAEIDSRRAPPSV